MPVTFICCFDNVEDVDECKEKLACQCPECNCKNTWGSYECRCNNGLFYVRESDMCIGECGFLRFLTIFCIGVEKK